MNPELQKALPLLPFAVELISDYLLIRYGKKDIAWYWRFPMFFAASLSYPDLVFHPVRIVACLLFYPFLDILLNKMRGLSWDYLSTTNGKWWDRTLVRLNPYFLLVLRFIVAFFIGFVVIKWL